MKYSIVLATAMGWLFLHSSLSAGAVATPAVLLKALTQSESHVKFPKHVQKQFRVTAPVKTRYSALKTVAKDGRLYIVYASAFPSIWDEDGVTATCKLTCQREAARHVLSKSKKLQRALEKFKWGKQVFGDHASLSLFSIAKFSFPRFTRFDLKIDENNMAVTIAIVPEKTLEIKTLELTSDPTVLQKYCWRLRKTAALYVERQRNYAFALNLLREASKHGDKSSDLLILLHQVHVAHGNTGEAHDILNGASTKFLSNLTAQQCNTLAEHASAYCDDINAAKWLDFAKAKLSTINSLNP